MLDREGYRPNVGIILLNQDNEVFWAKRIREKSWQFLKVAFNVERAPLKRCIESFTKRCWLKT